MSAMESEYDKVCFEKFRLKSFEDSIFEKNRKFCTSKKMAEAGFYFTPTEDKSDRVTCYACDVTKSEWKMQSDDPWTEHLQLNPDCVYLEKKKKPKIELTVNDFLLIEKHRFQRMNTECYESKKKKIETTIKAFEDTDWSVDKIQEKLKEINDANKPTVQ